MYEYIRSPSVHIDHAYGEVSCRPCINLALQSTRIYAMNIPSSSVNIGYDYTEPFSPHRACIMSPSVYIGHAYIKPLCSYRPCIYPILFISATQKPSLSFHIDHAYLYQTPPFISALNIPSPPVYIGHAFIRSLCSYRPCIYQTRLFISAMHIPSPVHIRAQYTEPFCSYRPRIYRALISIMCMYVYITSFYWFGVNLGFVQYVRPSWQ
jgi:hypothetical protein